MSVDKINTAKLEAATTQILYGPGGSQFGTRGFTATDGGDYTRLFNLGYMIDEKRRLSRIYQGKGELIDHILVSIKLLANAPAQLPVVKSHIDIFGRLPSMTDDPAVRRNGRNGQGSENKSPSDHAPITAEFEL